jgi:hypothetical protein
MLQRTLTSAALTLAVTLVCAQPARAQQTVNFTLGYFAPHGEDARVAGDVINANRGFLAFEVDDFGGPSVGGEWLLPLGKFFEAGAGVSFSRRTVPSVYLDYVDSDGTEIYQETRLRLIPIAFTVRVVPLGQSSPVQPYFGGGVGLIDYRYSETGEFVDFGAGRQIFRGSFVADGTEAGPVVLGGVRFASDSFSAGGEIRYQSAEADLSSDFAGSKLDLGGWTYNFTVGFRF